MVTNQFKLYLLNKDNKIQQEYDLNGKSMIHFYDNIENVKASI